jgi:hypothetical protein
MNERSSRSHTVFQLRISGERTLKSGNKQKLHGSLSLVDLAGSERYKKPPINGTKAPINGTKKRLCTGPSPSSKKTPNPKP